MEPMDTNDAQCVNTPAVRAASRASTSHAATARTESSTTDDDKHSSDFYNRLAKSAANRCDKKVALAKDEKKLQSMLAKRRKQDERMRTLAKARETTCASITMVRKHIVELKREIEAASDEEPDV